STIEGILGAISGVDKQQYLDVFSPAKCKIAVRIAAPVKKVRMGINLINTKGNYWIPYGNKHHEPRTQIRTEFLKDPCFRIYVSHKDDNILERLNELMAEHKSVYSVSLGLSELLADFKYIGLCNAESITGGSEVNLSSVIVFSNLIADGLEIETGKKYFKEKMPIVMNPERTIEKYDDVVFEPEGKAIKAKVNTYYRLENGENIAFF
ncbi:MAG: type I-B CRISPR-associated protein Cas5b, partial [Thermodesulfobacteriota bacterium]|nr:type I-B CRISPR-associated protein Cas5b [Thermodesulfobacteriota bacterium]